MTGNRAGELAELVALGLLHLAAEVMRSHLVGLVDHNQVPIGRGQPRLEVLVAGQVVEPRDQQVTLCEWVADARRLDHVAGEDLERQTELGPELVLPLLDQASGRDDEAAFDVTSERQLLAEQAGHDGLTGTWVVGEQEAKGLPRQHLRVDGVDLVREGVERRDLHRQVRVEQMRQRDPFGLGHQPEQVPVAVHRPGAALTLHDETRLVLPV
jgi:hypothetical protein